jgi:hypothetical protein
MHRLAIKSSLSHHYLTLCLESKLLGGREMGGREMGERGRERGEGRGEFERQ